MGKKQTSPNSKGLSAAQRDAIRLLVSGCTAKYTALVLKLDYASVRRWIKQDGQFQTELASQYEKQQVPPSAPANPPPRKKIPAVKDSGAIPRTVKSRGGSLPG
jgi:hypothetical protein